MIDSLPRLLRRLVTWFAPDEWHESLLGDLEEEARRRRLVGRSSGGLWMTVAALRVAIALGIDRRRSRLDRRTLWRGGAHMSDLITDFKHALRGLNANRGYAVMVVVTLALGIGANTAVFTLANWLLLRPVPGVTDQRRLVAIGFGTAEGARGPISFVDFQALEAGMPAVEGLAGYQRFSLHVAPVGRTPRRVEAEVVTANYFQVLGHPLVIGRGFTAAEGIDSGVSPVAVVSHRLWQEDFGGAGDVLGQSIAINGHRFTIAGVAVRGFRGASLSAASDLWVPIAQHKLALPMFRREILTSRTAAILFWMIGRLAPGAAIESARAQADLVRSSIAGANPRDSRMQKWRFDVRPDVESRPWVIDRIGRAMTLLTGIVGLVLLLTCANVGNLMLARTIGRRSEIAVRLAIGASRARVARWLLAESLTLSFAAGAIALASAYWTSVGLEGTVVLQGLPPLDRAELDWRVTGYALSISTVVALVAGVLPAFAAGKVDVNDALRDAGRAQTPTRQRVRRVLITAQVAVSVALLVGAALLVRSMSARLSIDPGFDPSKVLSFSVEPGLQNMGPREEVFYRDLLARIRYLPGVSGAGLVWLQPFSQGAADTGFRVEGATEDHSADLNMVSPGFFDAMGLELVAGRDFTETEFQRSDEAGGGVVVITESLARRAFGSANAVGGRIVMAYPEGRVRTVVGVIRETRQRRLTDGSNGMLFEPFGQTFPSGWASVVVGLAVPEEQVVPTIRQAVFELEPTLPVYDIIRLDRAIRRQFADDLLLARLTLAFAVLATLVAAAGLYGVLARSVSERRREFGIRTALGAGPGAVAALVTREALRVLFVGIAIGSTAAWILSRFVETRLFGITRLDPISFAGAIAVVIVVMLLSAAPAARRATALDPAAVLRA